MWQKDGSETQLHILIKNRMFLIKIDHCFYSSISLLFFFFAFSNFEIEVFTASWLSITVKKIKTMQFMTQYI